jgi:hypothetical protein
MLAICVIAGCGWVVAASGKWVSIIGAHTVAGGHRQHDSHVFVRGRQPQACASVSDVWKVTSRVRVISRVLLGLAAGRLR